MDTASFAEQYIALSRATGSVCDAFGNRVELKNIPKLLHKLSRGQFKLVWSESFCGRDHVALQRMDSTMSWPEMIDLRWMRTKTAIVPSSCIGTCRLRALFGDSGNTARLPVQRASLSI